MHTRAPHDRQRLLVCQADALLVGAAIPEPPRSERIQGKSIAALNCRLSERLPPLPRYKSTYCGSFVFEHALPPCHEARAITTRFRSFAAFEPTIESRVCTSITSLSVSAPVPCRVRARIGRHCGEVDARNVPDRRRSTLSLKIKNPAYSKMEGRHELFALRWPEGMRAQSIGAPRICRCSKQAASAKSAPGYLLFLEFTTRKSEVDLTGHGAPRNRLGLKRERMVPKIPVQRFPGCSPFEFPFSAPRISASS